MCTTLPVDILAQLPRLGTALVTTAQEHTDGTLAAVEAGVRAAVQAALPEVLRASVPGGAATGDRD